MKQYKILFTDLDGTLIDTISGNTFSSGIWDMKFNFDVLDAIIKLNPKVICIVSNQGGIQKGYVSLEGFDAKFKYIIKAIKEYTSINTKGEYCQFNNVSNIYRKPNTYMLKELMFQSSCICFDKKDCLMIGDASGLEGQYSDTDKKTAENFGIDYMDVDEFIKTYNG